MTRRRSRPPQIVAPAPHAYRRLGIVLPVMNMGGVERWAATLLKNIEGVAITGLISTSQGQFSSTMSRVAPLWDARRMDEFMENCDDIIAWTWEKPTLEKLKEFKGRLILVSHGSVVGDWSRSICRTMAGILPNADLVGVSDTSSMCWVFPGQPRVPTTLYNGIELDRCTAVHSREDLRDALKIPMEAKVALMFSRNAPEKRPAMFMEAMSLLRSRGWYGIFCGQQRLHYSPEWRSGPNVKVVSAVTCPGDLLHASDVLTLHSEQESFGLSLVEAWAAHVPTVACNWPVMSEFERLAEGSVCQVLPVKITAEDLAGALTKAFRQEKSITDRAYRMARTTFSARAFANRWARYLDAPGALDLIGFDTSSGPCQNQYMY